jgi:formylglycine-generating enzyme required for sulfatase activity
MSPEQWTGGQVDARSDLYSLVCAYYCLLTGRDPFSEVAPAALRHMHCHEPLPDPRQFTPKLPDAVCRILALGTHKTPQDRYQSASDLLAELDALLAASEESLTFGAPWEPLQGISGGEPSPARVERSEGTPAATAGLASQTKNMPRASTIAGKPLWSRQRIAIAGIGLSVLVLLGVVIYVTTNHGFVQIELPDPSANVEVKVDGDTVDVEGLAEPLRMTVGAHDLEVMSGGFQTFTKSFTVKRGQTEVVWVVFEPSPPLAVAPFSADEGRQHQQRWATFLGRRAVEGNSIGMKFVLIPAGEFTMGSPDSDKDASDDEKPSHRVRITRPYYLGATEVTQAQYFRVLGERPSYYSPAQLKIASTDDLPVESVAWKDAVRFCQKLTELENVGDSLRLKWKYRLPTEAEWEFACRGGSTSRWPTGDAPSDAKSIAWVAQGEPGSPRTVGSLQPHFGLYDMVGNVREFCSDWFGKYEPQDQTDPTGPASGTKHVIRGGCYYYRWEDSRCAARFANDDAAPNVGFRVVLEP